MGNRRRFTADFKRDAVTLTRRPELLDAAALQAAASSSSLPFSPSEFGGSEFRVAALQNIPIAFNGSALLSPLTGVGQYSKCLAEEANRDGRSRSALLLRSNLEPRHPHRPDQGNRRDQGVHQEVCSAALPGQPRCSAVAFQPRHPAHPPSPLPRTQFSAVPVRWAYGHHRARPLVDTLPGDASFGARRRDERTLPTVARGGESILTDAEFVRQEIIEEFGVAPTRITAVRWRAVDFSPALADECAAALSEYGLRVSAATFCALERSSHARISNSPSGPMPACPHGPPSSTRW